MTYIGREAFKDCTSLTSITIPNSVTSIGKEAFYKCKSLKNVTIPNGVTYIGEKTFSLCGSLTRVTIPNSVTSIGKEAFYACESLTSINVSSGNKKYKSIDDNLYSFDGKTLLQYAIGKTEKYFTIPNGVTAIGECAFWSCKSLTSVTIPNGVTSIGEYAFNYCSSLIDITIPNSVTFIGYHAFEGCVNLKNIYCRTKKPSLFGLPDGWNKDWLGGKFSKKYKCKAKVVWGYKGD